jgi:Putative Actinobacterial Holin-X, holin superfamily III
MPRNAKQVDASPRADIGELLHRATTQGKQWVEAEMTLARTELVDLRRRFITAVIFAVTAIAAMLCALIILAEAGVAAAAQYLGSEIGGGVAIGALFLIVAYGCVMVIGRMFDWRPESLLFRWLRKRA